MMAGETERTADDGRPLDYSEDFESTGRQEEPPVHSLTDDVMALFEDGKTYAQAELQFQKSRAGFTANRLKGAIAFGLGAFGVFHLALIAAAVGLVLALSQLVGPWIATAIVTIALIIVGIILLRLLKKRIDAIRTAFDGNGR